MRYRCYGCHTEEWRGYFPKGMFGVRYAVFHGVAIGVSSVAVKEMLRYMQYQPHGLNGALVSLGGCLLILCSIYLAALIVESLVVAIRGCSKCGSHQIYIE
jgi:hypothetical protein